MSSTTVPGLTQILLDYEQSLKYLPENKANKGQPDGYCGLDSSERISSDNLPLIALTTLNFLSGTDYTSPTLEPRHLVGQSGEPAFQNGWNNYGGTNAPCAFYKDNFGIVHLEGTIYGASMSVVFTLPSGYSPSNTRWFPIMVDISGTIITGTVYINADGTVNYYGNSNASFLTLDGVSFRP